MKFIKIVEFEESQLPVENSESNAFPSLPDGPPSDIHPLELLDDIHECLQIIKNI